MARAGSVAYQVSKIIKAHNGVGSSKREARNKDNLLGENNQKVSNKFHSYKSLDNARRDLINLGRFAKENYGIKDMSKIDINVVKEWINSKEAVYRTASNYLSELNKVSEYFNFSKNDIKELRSELKENLERTGKLHNSTRAYSNLDKVVLKSEKAQIAFELQRDYGLRLKEAIHINLNRQLKDNITLFVQGKGGKTIEKELSRDLLQKIEKTAQNGIFEVKKDIYIKELKSEIEKTGQNFNGTHGIRHSFAQKKLEEGYSKSQVSEMMGHNREEITNVYLR
jgi:site-specific recombinase XerD